MVESLLFVTDKPVTMDQLHEATGIERSRLQAALQQLISSIGYRVTTQATSLNETIIMLVVDATVMIDDGGLILSFTCAGTTSRT